MPTKKTEKFLASIADEQLRDASPGKIAGRFPSFTVFRGQGRRGRIRLAICKRALNRLLRRVWRWDLVRLGSTFFCSLGAQVCIRSTDLGSRKTPFRIRKVRI